MDVPRLSASSLPTSLIDNAIQCAFQQLKYTAPTNDQRNAILQFLSGRDVFISLPTGAGKSLCFASLPFVFDYIRQHIAPSNNQHHSICAVVSPLISLMKDQVAKFGDKGLKCAFVGGEQEDEDIKLGVLSGDYQLIYISPESLLRILQWREMLRSAVYQDNLVAIAVDEAHCVEKW